MPGQEIVIQRTLKKEREVIKQTSGYLIINGIKKELMPVELKAEIVNLLGYPDESLSKSKNYLFRYTVYTPQEEMKLILQEEAELRLDTLRKIFNVDKYKIIRENLQIYLKLLRTKIATSKTKLEPLEGKKQQMEGLKLEQTRIQELLSQLTPKIQDLQYLVQQKSEEITQQEQQQKMLQQKQELYKTNTAILSEKISQQRMIEAKIFELDQKVKSLPFLSSSQLEHSESNKAGIEKNQSDKLKKELEQLEQRRQEFMSTITKLEEKLLFIQQQITDQKKNVTSFNEQLVNLPEKEQLVQVLSRDLQQKDEVSRKKEQLEDLYLKTSEVAGKNEALLSQSLELQQKVSSLEICPTCLQQVTEEHKHGILDQENQKIKKAENNLFESRKNREIILQQLKDVRSKEEEFARKEIMINKLQVEISRLSEKKSQVQQQQEQIKVLIQQNNQLIEQLTALQKEKTLREMNQIIHEKKDILDSFLQAQYIQQQLSESRKQKEQLREEIKKVNEQCLKLEGELIGKEDISSMLTEKRRIYMEFLKQEKELAVQLAEHQTKLNGSQKQQEQLQQELDSLNLEKSELTRIQELYHWLEEYFLKLTYTIEKQVMINIHYHFNQIFQEWFSILIEDENMSSRLDDSFTPVIEQNGYEVSFAYLSGGEKTSAALAYRLALNKVINDVVHSIKTKDLLILDEPTDGFSSEQLDKVREVLERLKLQQIILVSHESKIESFVNKVIRVGKQGHVSEIS